MCLCAMCVTDGQERKTYVCVISIETFMCVSVYGWWVCVVLVRVYCVCVCVCVCVCARV
jgi:hypothetical protein